MIFFEYLSSLLFIQSVITCGFIPVLVSLFHLSFLVFRFSISVDQRPF